MISSKIEEQEHSIAAIESINNQNRPSSYSQVAIDYKNFVKLRLTLLVVFSAAFGYLFGSGLSNIHWNHFLLFLLGGFFVTGASNGLNQIIEVEYDRIMKRTADRGLPTGRMSRQEAIIATFLMLGIGLVCLYFINILCMLLGLGSLLVYAFFYTPVKRLSSLATLVGAFPGAIPPLLGMLASTGVINQAAIILFLIQFVWQFPHFWAIAWVCYEDYAKAGFKLMPTDAGHTKPNALQITIYTFLLVPISIVPYYFNMIGLTSTIIVSICSLIFFAQSLFLYAKLSHKAAFQLMFGSFFYLPIVQVTMLLGLV